MRTWLNRCQRFENAERTNKVGQQKQLQLPPLGEQREETGLTGPRKLAARPPDLGPRPQDLRGGSWGWDQDLEKGELPATADTSISQTRGPKPLGHRPLDRGIAWLVWVSGRACRGLVLGEWGTPGG